MRKYIVIKPFEKGLEKIIEKGTVLTLKDDSLYLNHEWICHKNSCVGLHYVRAYRKNLSIE